MPHLPPLRARRAALPFIAALVLAGCSGGGGEEEFTGTVVYDVARTGSAPDGGVTPTRVAVTWGRGGGFRLEQTGGLGAGVFIADFRDSTFFAVDSTERYAYPARIVDWDAGPAAGAGADSLTRPAEVEPTDEERTIAGHRCRVHRVVRSGAVRPPASARVCVAEDIRPRASRYEFIPFGTMSSSSPLPLMLGVREGLPLWMEVAVEGVVVTYQAASVSRRAPAASRFAVPRGYRIYQQPAS
ncbi:MAG TPA: hypothetical protein VFQ45_23765 [Longimicrobium sp.]|nr:hypothetical protein [Longimicrobium sp.]